MSPEAAAVDWRLPSYLTHDRGLKSVPEECVFNNFVRGVCGLLENAGVAQHGPRDSMERLR